MERKESQKKNVRGRESNASEQKAQVFFFFFFHNRFNQTERQGWWCCKTENKSQSTKTNDFFLSLREGKGE